MGTDMECSCACDVDYEGASFFSEKWRKARIAHICCECGEPILPGTRYEDVVGLWDGSFDTFKTCNPCHSIRSTYCGRGWIFGELREVIGECLGFDYVTGEMECWDCSYTLALEDQVCPQCGWEPE